jgi:penicillin-binding protein-related factor A (putative recombinase)
LKKHLKKLYPDAFIFKVPDFKQTYNTNGGLPDYLLINNGKTIWYEIKKPKNKKFLNINDFTDKQLIVFKKMLKNKADIKVMSIFNNTFEITDYKKIIKIIIRRKKL